MGRRLYRVHARLLRFIEQEDAGHFVDGWLRRAAPFGYGAGDGKLVGAGEPCGNAQPCGGAAAGKDVRQHAQVAVGRLDEELRLVLGVGTALKRLEARAAFTAIGGQVAVEGKALSVETAGHDGEHHAARADEGHHLEALLLSDADDVGPRVGNGGTARFGDDAHREPRTQRLKETVDSGGGRMAVQLVEGEAVDVDGGLDTLQETAGRTYVFHNEMAEREDDIAVVAREDMVDGRVAQRDGYQVERRHFYLLFDDLRFTIYYLTIYEFCFGCLERKSTTFL